MRDKVGANPIRGVRGPDIVRARSTLAGVGSQACASTTCRGDDKPRRSREKRDGE